MDEIQVTSTPPVDATQPTPPTPATATPVAPAQAVATPQTTPQAPATGAPPQEGWVPSYRLREAREAAERTATASAQAQIAQIRAEAERYQAQIRALTGQQPPQNPEIQAVRDQFGNLYPGLVKLEEQAAKIEALLERAGDLESQTNHYWQDYGRRNIESLFKLAEASYGNPLTDEGKRQLHSAFTGFVQSSPELTARYANDPSIVQDFWKEFTNSFIEPARRVASATVATRTATNLPQDTPSGAVRTSAPVQLKSLDERADAAWQLFQSKKGQ